MIFKSNVKKKKVFHDGLYLYVTTYLRIRVRLKVLFSFNWMKRAVYMCAFGINYVATISELTIIYNINKHLKKKKNQGSTQSHNCIFPHRSIESWLG